MNLALTVVEAAWSATRWVFRHRARARGWRRIAEACGLTNVREVRASGFTHRLEADGDVPLRVAFSSYPPTSHEEEGGSLIIGGLAPALRGPSRDDRLGGLDISKRLAEDMPPVAGPPLLLCALLDAPARRLVSGLFDERIDGEDGAVRSWRCRARIADGTLSISYAGDLFDDAVVGALRVARCLVAPEDPALAAARNLRGEADPRLRQHILSTLLEEAPRHPATREAARAGLADESDLVRLEAALGSGEPGRDVLRALAAGDTTETVRARAVTALGAGLSSAEVRALLEQAVARRQTRLAIACVELLGARGPAEADPLIEALGSADPGVMVACARALGAHADRREAVIALREAALLARDDRDLAQAVQEAVRTIQLRLEGAGAGQLSVAAGSDAGSVSLADDTRGRVAIDRTDDPAQS
jgi:hypothetical protein